MEEEWRKSVLSLSRPDIEADHSEKHKRKVNGLGFEVLLMEEDCGTGEAHKNASATYHRHNTDHRLWLGERIKIDKIGGTEEHTYADDTPIPMEGCRLLSFWPP